MQSGFWYIDHCVGDWGLGKCFSFQQACTGAVAVSYTLFFFLGTALAMRVAAHNEGARNVLNENNSEAEVCMN